MLEETKGNFTDDANEITSEEQRIADIDGIIQRLEFLKTVPESDVIFMSAVGVDNDIRALCTPEFIVECFLQLNIKVSSDPELRARAIATMVKNNMISVNIEARPCDCDDCNAARAANRKTLH